MTNKKTKTTRHIDTTQTLKEIREGYAKQNAVPVLYNLDKEYKRAAAIAKRKKDKLHHNLELYANGMPINKACRIYNPLNAILIGGVLFIGGCLIQSIVLTIVGGVAGSCAFAWFMERGK